MKKWTIASTILLLCALSICGHTSNCSAESPFSPTPPQEAASLILRFKIKTLPPPAVPRPFAARFCGGVVPADESLVVNRTNHGIQNVFLTVYTGRRGTQLPEMKLESKTVTMEVTGCRLQPHAVIARAGDRIQVINRDPVGHALNFQFFKNPPSCLILKPPLLADIRIDFPEPAPIPIACNIHPWIHASLLVLDHPFGAVSDEDGIVRIEGLPANKRITFRAYHESGRFDGPGMQFRGTDATWRANKFPLTLQPGENDLGDVVVDW